MSSLAESDRLLVERVRNGQDDAWRELIARFEGRLLAFVEARIGSRAASEDVVQETFLGFLTSLPNYDPVAVAGELSVFDRRAQADRPLAARRPPADACRFRRRRRAARGNRPPGGAAPAACCAAASGRAWKNNRPGRRRSASRSSGCASGATGISWPAWSCCSSAAGATRRPPAELELSEQIGGQFQIRVSGAAADPGAASSIRAPTYFPSSTSRAMQPSFSDAELAAYLDEALAPEAMAEFERAARDDAALLARLAEVSARRDAGVHSLGEIWRRHRLSCPTREQWGSYLLGTLEARPGRAITSFTSKSSAAGSARPICRTCGAEQASQPVARRGAAAKILPVERCGLGHET